MAVCENRRESIIKAILNVTLQKNCVYYFVMQNTYNVINNGQI